MENALNIFVAVKEAKTQQHCNSFLDEAIAIAARVIRQRLPEINNSDFDDLRQTVLVKVVQKLREVDSENGNTCIRNFEDYVARITHNVCNDYLRAKLPARMRLKHHLLGLFRRHSTLSLWKCGETTLCGFHIWSNRTLDSDTDEKLNSLYTKFHENNPPFPLKSNHTNSSTNGNTNGNALVLVTNIFGWLKSPLVFKDLVELVAEIQGVAQITSESFNGEEYAYQDSGNQTIAFHQAIVCEDIDRVRALLKQIWGFLQTRSLNQRRAFLYTSADENGESFLFRLLNERTVSISELSISLEVSTEHLFNLISNTPMDMTDAEAELGATKANIYKWKHRVQERLWDALKENKKK